MRVLTMCCLASFFGAGVATPVMAAPFQQSTSDIAIPAMPLNQALNAFAQREHLQLVYVSKIADGVRTKGAPAGLSPEATLQKLLEGTGLGYRFLNAKTVTIYTPTEPRTSGSASTREPLANSGGAKNEPTTLNTVTVTGTRIRGGTTPSPVITIGAENIQEEGFSDLGEVIRSMPQNYSGGQNPGVLGANTGSSNVTNQNGTGGSGLNLRGLGPDATLTLLNGRRMSYSSFAQAIDISAIPVEAVDRVEIVADGASAIYGSDAVAGVGNVILKRDFEGVTVGARFGGATEGGLMTREYTATAGTTWSSGGLIATYKNASADPIYADQRSYTERMYDPYTLYPGSDLRSGLLSVHQSLGDAVEVSLDALQTNRTQQMYQGYPGFYYDFTTDTKTSFVAPSINVTLPADWTLVLGGTWGKDDSTQKIYSVTTGSSASSLVVNSCYCNKSRSYEVSAEGPLFAMGDDSARLAVGVGYRANELVNRSFLSGQGYGGREGSHFAYGEVNLPLIGSTASPVDAQRLSFTVAVRSEDYDSFGRVTTPKLGLIYNPGADFTLKASWGKSFKAPTLDQKYQPQYAYLRSASAVGGSGYPADATVLMSWGGSALPLEPERAKTQTVSVAFHPAALPALEGELSWFNIDYADRVVQPLTGFAQSLSNPGLAEFINYAPTLQEQAELLSQYSYAFYNSTGAAYDPSKVVAIGYGQYANAKKQWIDGVDLSGSYRFDLQSSRLTIRGSASRLNIRQRLTADLPSSELAGALYYPAKFRARVGAVWVKGRFTVSTFANYTAGLINRLPAQVTEKTASFTTFDTALRYAIPDGDSVWSGLELALFAQNLFDRTPPLHTTLSPTYVPYDSSNYSAIGRFLGVSVSKHW